MPHLFHYVDLTIELVRRRQTLIDSGLHTQPKTDLKHFRQLFNSLKEVLLENVVVSVGKCDFSPSITGQNEFIIFHPRG
jgi:hypothetical protein